MLKLVETHIEVNDVRKSIDLYSRLFAHKDIITWAEGNVSVLVLEDGSAFGCWKKGQIGLHNGRGGAHVHYAFQIQADEYLKYFNVIKDCGLTPIEHEWETGDKSLYFFDYDGNQGEFITTDWITLNDL